MLSEMDKKLDFHKTIDIFCNFLRNPTEKHPVCNIHFNSKGNSIVKQKSNINKGSFHLMRYIDCRENRKY